MKTPFAASFALLMTCVSMALPQAQIKPIPCEYYPLEEGHKWTYRVTDLRSPRPKGERTATVIEVERTENYSVKVVKGNEEVEKIYTGYILKNRNGDKTTRDQVVVTEKGVHFVHVAGAALSPPQLFFKTWPKNAGEQWDGDSKAGIARLKGTFTVNSAAVEVPFKKFDVTFHISYRSVKVGDDVVEVERWFAKDVGMVKQRVRAKNLDTLLELEKFEKK